MKIEIRKATKADLPSIYNLVKSLAIYEKAEQEVTATLEDYHSWHGLILHELFYLERSNAIPRRFCGV